MRKPTLLVRVLTLRNESWIAAMPVTFCCRGMLQKIWNSIRGGALIYMTLGTAEEKHGIRIHVVNLGTDEVGNAEIPGKFRQAKAPRPTPAVTISRGLL